MPRDNWEIMSILSHKSGQITGTVLVNFVEITWIWRGRCLKQFFHGSADLFCTWRVENECRQRILMTWWIVEEKWSLELWDILLGFQIIMKEEEIFKQNVFKKEWKTANLLRELHLWLKTFTFPLKLSFSLRPPCPSWFLNVKLAFWWSSKWHQTCKNMMVFAEYVDTIKS